MNQQQLICSLIKDDLTSRLINGLNQIGLDAGDYFIHLSETIFQLMGFENNHHTDEAYSHHLKLTRKAQSINLLSPARHSTSWHKKFILNYPSSKTNQAMKKNYDQSTNKRRLKINSKFFSRNYSSPVIFP
jgi:hypothetical protein